MRKASAETLEMEKCKETRRDICVLEAAEGVDTERTGLKRKVINYPDGEFRYSTSVVQRRIFRRLIGETENNTTKRMETAASSLNDPCCSCCSSHGSTHIYKEASEFSDLELQEEQREIIGDVSTSPYGLDSCRERRESMSDVIAESFDLKVTGELPSSTLNTEEIDVNPSRRSKRAKMPSDAELEEFFSVPENELMQQFSHKYNFDFVKEEPFEGLYEWVRVKENSDTWRPHCNTTVGYTTHEQEDNNKGDTWSLHCDTTVRYMISEQEDNNESA